MERKTVGQVENEMIELARELLARGTATEETLQDARARLASVPLSYGGHK